MWAFCANTLFVTTTGLSNNGKHGPTNYRRGSRATSSAARQSSTAMITTSYSLHLQHIINKTQNHTTIVLTPSTSYYPSNVGRLQYRHYSLHLLHTVNITQNYSAEIAGTLNMLLLIQRGATSRLRSYVTHFAYTTVLMRRPARVRGIG